ncbi:hypothetical protein M231_04861 [Tremella mesenterica]|uniref:Uncharacterized protein n=1 Tax=Tremella mesenterica TaxID=5217 RepID=A0A4Q1BJI0_TREME|nr:hypothetical protein M231_04861 [Tremella mesenterica]
MSLFSRRRSTRSQPKLNISSPIPLNASKALSSIPGSNLPNLSMPTLISLATLPALSGPSLSGSTLDSLPTLAALRDKKMDHTLSPTTETGMKSSSSCSSVNQQISLMSGMFPMYSNPNEQRKTRKNSLVYGTSRSSFDTDYNIDMEDDQLRSSFSSMGSRSSLDSSLPVTPITPIRMSIQQQSKRSSMVKGNIQSQPKSQTQTQQVGNSQQMLQSSTGKMKRPELRKMSSWSTAFSIRSIQKLEMEETELEEMIIVNPEENDWDYNSIKREEILSIKLEKTKNKIFTQWRSRPQSRIRQPKSKELEVGLPNPKYTPKYTFAPRFPQSSISQSGSIRNDKNGSSPRTISLGGLPSNGSSNKQTRCHNGVERSKSYNSPNDRLYGRHVEDVDVRSRSSTPTRIIEKLDIHNSSIHSSHDEDKREREEFLQSIISSTLSIPPPTFPPVSRPDTRRGHRRSSAIYNIPHPLSPASPLSLSRGAFDTTTFTYPSMRTCSGEAMSSFASLSNGVPSTPARLVSSWSMTFGESSSKRRISKRISRKHAEERLLSNGDEDRKGVMEKENEEEWGFKFGKGSPSLYDNVFYSPRPWRKRGALPLLPTIHGSPTFSTCADQDSNSPLLISPPYSIQNKQNDSHFFHFQNTTGCFSEYDQPDPIFLMPKRTDSGSSNDTPPPPQVSPNLSCYEGMFPNTDLEEYQIALAEALKLGGPCDCDTCLERTPRVDSGVFEETESEGMEGECSEVLGMTSRKLSLGMMGDFSFDNIGVVSQEGQSSEMREVENGCEIEGEEEMMEVMGKLDSVLFSPRTIPPGPKLMAVFDDSYVSPLQLPPSAFERLSGFEIPSVMI